MQAIFDAITGFFDWIILLPVWILDVILTGLNSVLVMLKDLFFWLFEQVLDLAIAALGELDLSGITQYAQEFGSLPGEIVNVLGLVGFGECMGIIFTALMIRLVLQLIPFVRLGS